MATKHIPGRRKIYTVEHGFSPEQLEAHERQRKAEAQQPEDDVAIQRLLDIYCHATPDEITEGLQWYHAARELCMQMVLDYQGIRSVEQAAGIIAALSPKTEWSDNIRRAHEFLVNDNVYGGSYIVRFQKGDTEKVSPYECGFNPFEDARHKFQVKFYLVRILFLIFDLEVIYLFPWAVTFNTKQIIEVTLSESNNMNQYRNRLTYGLEEINFIMIMIFLFILTVGFVYEWKKGALEWE